MPALISLRKFKLAYCAGLILFAVLSLTQLIAQGPEVQPQYQQQLFNRREVMIPLRDGIHLQTVIFTPKDAHGPLPILLERTPYGVPDDERQFHSGSYDDLIADGYIFVEQNIRGRFQSEGTFVMQRPPR